MRTTINIDDQLFYEAKKLAVESHKTFTVVVEEVLRRVLAMRNVEKKHYPFSLAFLSVFARIATGTYPAMHSLFHVPNNQ